MDYNRRKRPKASFLIVCAHVSRTDDDNDERGWRVRARARRHLVAKQFFASLSSLSSSLATPKRGAFCNLLTRALKLRTRRLLSLFRLPLFFAWRFSTQVARARGSVRGDGDSDRRRRIVGGLDVHCAPVAAPLACSRPSLPARASSLPSPSSVVAELATAAASLARVGCAAAAAVAAFACHRSACVQSSDEQPRARARDAVARRRSMSSLQMRARARVPRRGRRSPLLAAFWASS